MIKLPFNHSFIVPSKGIQSNILIQKVIDNIEQLYYYLYLSAISLPNEGIANPYYYSFRENKKYQINSSTPKEFDYIYNTGEQFIIVTKYIKKELIKLKLIPGISRFVMYVPEHSTITINNSNNTISNSINTIQNLKIGGKINTQKSHRLININEQLSTELELTIESSPVTDIYMYIHIDKYLFVKWMRERTNTYIDKTVSIYDYGSYVQNNCTASIKPTQTITNCDIKKVATFDQTVSNINTMFPMRYNNEIQIPDATILLSLNQTLLSYSQNPFGDYIYNYYFSNPFIDNKSIPINLFSKMYFADIQNNTIYSRIIISPVSSLKNIYFLRKIPGLKSLKFNILQFPTKHIDFSNFINISDITNYDVFVTEEDYMCNRFKRPGYTEVEIPKCSITYCPILKINPIYKSSLKNNIYFVCNLEIDANILIHAINISNSNFDLWNVKSATQSTKFLIDEFFISPLQDPIPTPIIHSLLSDSHYFNFNNNEGVLLNNFNFNKYYLHLTKDVNQVVFFKYNRDNYNLSITHDYNESIITNDTSQHFDNIADIIYSKYMFMSKEEKNNYDYKFDIVNGQLLKTYFTEYYSTREIPSEYNIDVTTNTFKDSNFVIYKNPYYNIKDSNMLVSSLTNFNIYVKRDNKNHKRIINKYKTGLSLPTEYKKPLINLYLHGFNKLNCNVVYDSSLAFPISKYCYYNDTLIKKNTSNSIAVYKAYDITPNRYILPINTKYKFVEMNINPDYDNLFEKIKVNNFIDIEDFYKVVNKQQPFTLDFIKNQISYKLPLHGNLNQIVSFSSSSKSTNIIISKLPFKLECDINHLINVDFMNIFMRYSIYIGKLVNPVYYDVRNNDDLTLYFIVFKNLNDLQINFTYNQLIPNQPNLKPSVLLRPKFKRFHFLLNRLYGNGTHLNTLGHILNYAHTFPGNL